MITVSKEKPPIYPRLAEKFGADIWDRGVVITYGEQIHCKSGHPAPSIFEHEKVHVLQQLAMGRDEWWTRYLEDPEFRLSQELEAYKVEAQYIRRNYPNRRKQAEKLDWLAQSMAANYAGMISYAEAKSLL